jgi:hypothetical protein
MRIYSRPWPVTALFREVYKLLRPTLGPGFWPRPPPLAAPGESWRHSARAAMIGAARPPAAGEAEHRGWRKQGRPGAATPWP